LDFRLVICRLKGLDVIILATLREIGEGGQRTRRSREKTLLEQY